MLIILIFFFSIIQLGCLIGVPPGVMQKGVDMCVKFLGKKRYEDVRFNVISVTRGWAGVNFPEKGVT